MSAEQEKQKTKLKVKKKVLKPSIAGNWKESDANSTFSAPALVAAWLSEQ